ncbi:MAG: SIS domain-containing protein [Magnetococcales bacterium]|nr:SIS domain-containing protein [Magnetococcales bacterium]
MSNNQKDLYKPGQDAGSYFKSYNDYLHKQLQQIDSADIEALSQAFLTARKNKNTIFFIGNGGSASTASHFAQDLATVGRKAGVDSFSTLSLTDNNSYITALGNDIGYDHIFSEQMRYLFKEGDLLIAISASGNSPNILVAVEFAKKLGGKTFALAGFDGGKLAQIADNAITVLTPKGEYGPVEDGHMIIDHVVTCYLLEVLKQEKQDG